jgi:hypothetical protein
LDAVDKGLTAVASRQLLGPSHAIIRHVQELPATFMVTGSADSMRRFLDYISASQPEAWVQVNREGTIAVVLSHGAMLGTDRIHDVAWDLKLKTIPLQRGAPFPT